MALTRSSAAHGAARLFDLLTLPDDLLVKVARHALAMEVPAALRLLQTCTALKVRLGVVRAEAEARKIEWAVGRKPAGRTWRDEWPDMYMERARG